jgi:anti-sigma B factor antagonist
VQEADAATLPGSVGIGLGPGVGPPEEQLIRIVTDHVGDGDRRALVVSVAGEIDIRTTTWFRAAVTDGLKRLADQNTDAGPLVVDLTGVTFLASSGLHALVDAARAAGDRGAPLRLVVNRNRPVVHPIELTGLETLLELYGSIEQALHGPPRTAESERLPEIVTPRPAGRPPR